MEQKSNSNFIKIIGVVFVVVVVGIVAWQVVGNSQMDSLSAPANGLTVGGQKPGTGVTVGEFRDGTYTATGNYQSPAQLEEVEVTLTVNGGVVTDAVFVSKATHPTSKLMQGKFSEGFEEAVVGKNIDDLNLTVVNGSSLTPKGFMDALKKIKSQAQV